MSAASKVFWRYRALPLFALFILALIPRLYSAQTVGWGWDGPGSFTLVNFDEGGSCRAALEGFEYSTLVGRQTIAIADLLGQPPPADIVGDAARVKQYCHSPGHILIARSYSAILGAMTVVVLAVLALQLLPQKPQIAWTAGALLALSGFHLSESHSGTVDAPSAFFIYLFLVSVVAAHKHRSPGRILLSLVLLILVVGTKYWVFAPFAFLAFLPPQAWSYLTQGLNFSRLVVLVLASVTLVAAATNSAFPLLLVLPLFAVFYLLVPWRKLPVPMRIVWLLVPLMAFGLSLVDLFAAYTTGNLTTPFGTGYAAIGWNKWLRNLLNVPVVLLVGLGLPAFLFIPRGIKAVLERPAMYERWLCLLPLLIFLLFMMLLSAVTYYRHYLPLIPIAVLLASIGFWHSRWSAKRWALMLFLAWPALLALDIEQDYHQDPRIAMRDWYTSNRPERVFYSFYVNPPAQFAGAHRLFTPEYAQGDAASMQLAQYLVLSENWYDTAFANELNGPLVGNLDRLVKTRPEYATFYRRALAGQHPNLEADTAFEVVNFMPELLLHSAFYGTFQILVGDIHIWRITDGG